MPRRAILSANDQAGLLALPDNEEGLIRHYTFNEPDLSLIRQRRGDANRLGFAVQLCLLRYPGYAVTGDVVVTEAVIGWIANQIKINPTAWDSYGKRDETRREHYQEIRSYLGLVSFGLSDFRWLVQQLTTLAMQTDKGLVLASEALSLLRQRQTIVPALTVIDRVCSEAISRANKQIYKILTDPLTKTHRDKLDALLVLKRKTTTVWLTWLRQSPLKSISRYLLEHIQRLKTFQAIQLPENLGQHIHQNRLLKLAREGGQMTPQDLGKFSDTRRYATLVALVLEGSATVTDKIIDLHDRIMLKLFSNAKHKHQQAFHLQGKAINDKIRLYSKIGHALLDAKDNGGDPYKAIESVIPWELFVGSVTEADQLARPESFDYLNRLNEQIHSLRRYIPEFLDVLKLRAVPAAKNILDATSTIRQMYVDKALKLPLNPPISFIKPRWQALVFTDQGVDRSFYEICALSELKNALRSGDIWGQGSCQFRDFDGYLLPVNRFEELKQADELPIATNTDCEGYLSERLNFLEEQLSQVNKLALANELPDAILTDSGLKITPLDAVIPEFAQQLINKTDSMLPRVKITELLSHGRG
jgi:TnpA family transposase